MRILALLMLSLIIWPFTAYSKSNDNLVPVVASFSILADITKQLGGSKVSVSVLIGPESDAHSFEPSPLTIRSLSEASLLVSNGLGFETWLPSVIKSSGFKGQHVVASNGVNPRLLVDSNNSQSHDNNTNIDPHAWQSLKNGLLYADNITAGLISIDPSNKQYYIQQLNKYSTKINNLHNKILHSFKQLSAGSSVVTAHDAFAYFGIAYGVNFIPISGLSSQAEPSAHEVARLVNLAKEHKVQGFFTEAGSNNKLINQLARETNTKVGGPLYADTLASKNHLANTYLGMFEWNSKQLLDLFNLSYD